MPRHWSRALPRGAELERAVRRGGAGPRTVRPRGHTVVAGGVTPRNEMAGQKPGHRDTLDESALSIPVVIRLVRALLRHADVVGLVLAQLGELHADLGEVQ